MQKYINFMEFAIIYAKILTKCLKTFVMEGLNLTSKESWKPKILSF